MNWELISKACLYMLTYHVDPDAGLPRLPAAGVVGHARQLPAQVLPPQRPQLEVVLGRAALRVAKGLVQQGTFRKEEYFT